MNIQRGADWGERAPVPDDAVWADDDSIASEILSGARRAGATLPPVCLTGGDLARTLGGRGDADLLRATGGTHVKVDLVSVLIDGRQHWFLAHMVVRRSWLRGRVVIAANAAFLGPWNIAPRAHPGDGRLDLLDANLPFGERLKARRRLPSGTHIPHPDIEVRQAAAAQFDLVAPTPVYLDGRSMGPATTISVRVEQADVDVWV